MSYSTAMTSKQLQTLLDKVGLSQRAAAKALGINDRSMRRYCAGDAPIPKAIEIAITCLCSHQDKEI